MQNEVVAQVKTMRESIAKLHYSDKNAYEVEFVIRKLIELIGQTEKPSDFLFPVFKGDMIDDLTVLSNKHLKNYWNCQSETDKLQAFNYIQSELLFSLVLVLMNLEQN